MFSTRKKKRNAENVLVKIYLMLMFSQETNQIYFTFLLDILFSLEYYLEIIHPSCQRFENVRDLNLVSEAVTRGVL